MAHLSLPDARGRSLPQVSQALPEQPHASRGSEVEGRDGVPGLWDVLQGLVEALSQALPGCRGVCGVAGDASPCKAHQP